MEQAAANVPDVYKDDVSEISGGAEAEKRQTWRWRITANETMRLCSFNNSEQLCSVEIRLAVVNQKNIT